MSKAKVYGLSRYTLTPGPALVITKATDGTTTAKMDFRCIRGDHSLPQIRAKLAKGVLIENLYSQVPQYYKFLTVDSWESDDGEAPGVTVVNVIFKGVSVPEPGQDDEDENLDDEVFTRNTSLVEVPIQLTKEWVDLSGNEPELIAGGIRGDYHKEVGTSWKIRDANQREVGTITSDGGKAMWYKAVTKGIDKASVPATEWTHSYTRKGKLPAAKLSTLGQVWAIGDIPGVPSVVEIDGQTTEWKYTGVTENITGNTATGTNQVTRTWTATIAVEAGA